MKDHIKVNGISLPKSVAILYSDVKREYFPTYEQYLTEKDAKHDAHIIASYLEKLGIKVYLFAGNASLPEKLKKSRPEVVINLVDSVKGYENMASTIPALLELLDIPYTGAGVLGMSLDGNKFLIKKILQQNGIPTPNYQLFNAPLDPLDSTLRFPLISKLNSVHGAVEIDENAVSENEKHLRERIKRLISLYRQPVLVEEFIVGKEITAILLEGLNKKVYLAEKVFNKPKDRYIFATFKDQWIEKGYDSYHYQKYNDPVLKEYVKKAFEVVEMYDYGKFDIRVDGSGRYFFIDSNCNCAFGPKELNTALSTILDLYGINFFEILKRLLLNTKRDAMGKERLPLPGENNVPPPGVEPGSAA